MLNRRFFAVSIALAPFTKAAAATDWPQRPVRILFPYSAGGTGDATARLIAGRLGDILGQPFVVENRVGANGVIATEMVAHAAADGYTLLWAITPQIAISPAMTKVPYDPVKDFVPIATVSANRFALVVNSKLPVTTVAEFIAYVRAQPKGLIYAEAGTGSISHLAMVLFLNRARLSGTNVSYKGPGALLDVVAGRLPAMFALFSDALAQAKSGAIRLLAVSSAHRLAQAPSVPTIAESGFPGFRVTSWWGLMAPAGTPRSVVDRIAAEVGDAIKDPKIVAQLTHFGVDPLGSSPTEFATMISADIKLWSEAVKLAGLKSQ